MTVSEAWTLRIPAPANWLNANDRMHWREKAHITKAWRDAAHVRARAERLPKLGRAKIVAELNFPVRRRRDPANYHPTVKAVVDGLVDYGLLPDDSDEYLIGPELRLGPPTGRVGGEMFLTIEPVT